MLIFRTTPALISLLLFTGCGGKDAAARPHADGAPAAPNAAVLAVLAKADAKDGTTDNVVHRCAGCALGMDGKAEHSLKVGGYTMHFCNDGCLAEFSGETEKAILALKIKD